MSRRSTVYDYSSLSLHPDGSCTGESSRLWRPQAHVDTRGNLVAPPPKFIFYTKAKSIVDDENQGEEFDLSDVESTPTTSRKGKQKERTPEADGRARGAKRRKVVHDFGFLETSVPQTTTASSSTSSFAVPSSDLLKSIHHFACNHYSDRGQLFNDSRAYRKAKKQRRLAKLAMKQKVQAGEIDSGEEDPDTSPTKPDKTRRRDMYKTLDGSALLAVGMLLQEHVARIMAPKIPDGWEESLLEEYEDDEEEEDQEPDQRTVGTSDAEGDEDDEEEEDQEPVRRSAESDGDGDKNGDMEDKGRVDEDEASQEEEDDESEDDESEGKENDDDLDGETDSNSRDASQDARSELESYDGATD